MLKEVTSAFALVLIALLAVSGHKVLLGEEKTLSQVDLLSFFEEEEPRGEGLRKVSIESVDQWQRKRRQIEKRILHVMGPFPAFSEPLVIEVTIEEQLPDFLRRKIRYTSGTGDSVTAWLLIPETGASKLPAIVALHPTAPTGKDVVAGIGHRPGRNYGEELARRGYVVLAPDILTAGERVLPGKGAYETNGFDRDNPQWSMMGKMAWDHRRGVDVLASLPQVDGDRIGTIGHSLGGYNAIWLAAFEPRIKAAVSSCGWASLSGAPSPFHFSRREWFVHFPALRLYLSAGITPFDFHEAVALIAPRAFLNYSTKQDQFFPNWQDIAQDAEQVRQVYRLHKSEENFRFVLGEGEHDFPDAVRLQAYAFLDKFLRR
ncbi:MAG: alpha/beta hydrolase family protein [Acidobacteriota bacterium]